MTPIKTLAALLIVIGTVGCAEGYSQETYFFDEPVSAVFVNTDLGDVIVERADAFENTSVSVELDCETVAPDYELSLENQELSFGLTVDSGATACDGVIHIRTNSEATLDIRTGRGEVSVSNMEGATMIVSYDGDVTLDKVSGDLDVTVVSGITTGIDVRSARSSLTVGAGDVSLTYTQRPKELDLDILSGSATIRIPSDSYKLDLTTEAGRIRVLGIVEDAGSESALHLSTDAGDLNVQGQ